jgi:tetratricopeptide (TPR) repeat protein
LGNKAFAAKDYDKAIDLFSQAIAIDPKNHVLYSNRSAAHAGKREWDDALKDADQVRTFPGIIQRSCLSY